MARIGAWSNRKGELRHAIVAYRGPHKPIRYFVNVRTSFVALHDTHAPSIGNQLSSKLINVIDEIDRARALLEAAQLIVEHMDRPGLLRTIDALGATIDTADDMRFRDVISFWLET